MPTTITSRRSPVVARVREVARGGDRDHLLLDGPHLVRGAVDCDLTIEQVIVSTDGRHDDEIRRLLEAMPPGVRVATVSSSVMRAVSPVRSPGRIVAIARAPAGSADRVFRQRTAIVIAADIQDPGNVGAIVRVADAGGAAGVLVAGRTANPFGWKALRGSMASALRLPIAQYRDVDAAIDEARRHGWRIAATAPAGGTPHVEADLRGAVAFVIGGEGGGLPASVIAGADQRLTIPMEPGVESLNAAAAAAILVYEARRQRRARAG